MRVASAGGHLGNTNMSRNESLSRARALCAVGASATHDTELDPITLHALFEQIGELLEAPEGE